MVNNSENQRPASPVSIGVLSSAEAASSTSIPTPFATAVTESFCEIRPDEEDYVSLHTESPRIESSTSNLDPSLSNTHGSNFSSISLSNNNNNSNFESPSQDYNTSSGVPLTTAMNSNLSATQNDSNVNTKKKDDISKLTPASTSSSLNSIAYDYNYKKNITISSIVPVDDSADNDQSSSTSNPDYPTDASTVVHPQSSSYSSEPIYRTYKRRWIGLLGLSLLNIMISWGWLSFSAISLYSAQWLNLSSETPINWLSTVILFSYVVSSPIVSFVLEKHSLKVAMYICAVLMVIGNWLRYAGICIQSFGLVMFGQILIGLAQPFALSSPTHFTNLWFTSRSRVSANAIASISNPLGGAIAQLVGPAIVSEPSQLKTFILVTACVSTGASLITFVAPTHPPSPPCESANVPVLPLKQSLKILLRSPSFLLALAMFSVYVGLFNAYSTFINQIMEPYGYTSDEAGYAGATLIIAGIVCAAISSPILDRFHHYIGLFTCALPVVAGCYIALIYTQTMSLQLVGPFLVSGVLGAISFSLLPALLEWVQEQTFPATPSLSSSLLWNGGELLGAIFIIAMNALKYSPNEGSPAGNMKRALIFQAVWACVGIIPIFFLKKYSRPNSRIVMDKTLGDSRKPEYSLEEDGTPENDRASIVLEGRSEYHITAK